MDLTTRAISPDEFAAYYAAIELGFGGVPRDEERALHEPVTEWDRSLATFDGDRIVGTAGAFSFSMTVPGAAARVAGVTSVAVAPTHRRRGLLTRMMREQLDDVRARGEAVAALFASEPAIYSRFGYGLAALAVHVKADTRRSGFLDGTPAPGQVELLQPADATALLHEAYDAARASRPGMFARTEPWWRRRLADPEHWRAGGSPLRAAVHRSDAGTGYALYRTIPAWHDSGPDGTVEVREIVTSTPAAEASLWRFLLDLDLMHTVQARHLPLDTALLHLLADARAAGARLSDNLWVRLVDVPAALRLRRYAVPAAVTIEVRDGFCEWNSGCYRLSATPDGAECDPVSGPPDVTLSAADLGAVYLGGTRLGSLAAAGRVVGTPEALRSADAMFAWPVLPACPEVF